jgi:hypothetical protein
VQQLENFDPAFFGQAQLASLIVKDVARPAALQDSGGAVVEVVDNRYDLSAQVGAKGKMREQALVELALGADQQRTGGPGYFGLSEHGSAFA